MEGFCGQFGSHNPYHTALGPASRAPAAVDVVANGCMFLQCIRPIAR